MRTMLLTTGFVIISQILFAQTQFQYRYGSQFADFSNRVIQTNDGNFIIVGSTNGFGSSGNVFVMKADSIGNVLWIKDYAGINYDEAFDVIETLNSELIICGATHSFGAGSLDGFLMKTDSIGNVIWAKSYGNIYGDYFLKVMEDNSGGYFVAGYAQKINSGSPQGTVILRMDNNGIIDWEKWLPAWVPQGSGWYPIDFTTSSSGGVVLTGTNDNGNKINCWKFSDSGNLIWSYGYNAPSQGHRIIEDIYGNLYLTAYQYGIAASVDIAVLKIDSIGIIQWFKSYGGTYIDLASSITKTTDGSIIICGRTNSIGNGDNDACLIKIDSSGIVEWAKAYGTIWYESPTGIMQTSDDGFVMSGFTYSFGNDVDSLKIHVVKTDSMGNTACNSIIWNPIVLNDTISIITPLVPDTILLQVNTITWSINNRSFYDVNICNPTSVTEINSFEELIIYPNPFFDHVSIEINTPNMQNITYSIKNILGETVLTKEVNNINKNFIKTIDLDFLSNGIYLIDVNIDGVRKIKKIVKQ